MLGLPSSTLVRAQLAKSAIYEQLHFKAHERATVDADVSRIDIVAQLTPDVLPGLVEGTSTRIISLLRLTLKRPTCSPDTLRLLNRIPQALVFILTFGQTERLATCFAGRVLISREQPEGTTTLTLQGPNLDALWLHLVAGIAGLDDDTEPHLRAQLEQRERQQALLKKITQLERKKAAERQPRRRIALYYQIEALKQQLHALHTTPPTSPS